MEITTDDIIDALKVKYNPTDMIQGREIATALNHWLLARSIEYMESLIAGFKQSLEKK